MTLNTPEPIYNYRAQPPRATRVRQNDQPQICPLCKTVIMASQPIADLGDVAVHLACTLHRQPMIGPASGQ
jgi:hypothetical protein